jgi:hypothetical protein
MPFDMITIQGDDEDAVIYTLSLPNKYTNLFRLFSCFSVIHSRSLGASRQIITAVVAPIEKPL